MQQIFDFGMYDASDTEYYLEQGYKVVAVEANPALAKRAQHTLAQYVNSGQLVVINAAIAVDSHDVSLTICGDDLGSSSVYQEKLLALAPLATFTVPGITTEEIIERYGVPYYMKVDIEGADRLSVLALSAATKPHYLSFEIGGDLEELMAHLQRIGFSEFQAINQCNLRELSVENNFRDRVALKLTRVLGYTEPRYARRSGRFFKLGHSSGPGPWTFSKGWRSIEQFWETWNQPKASDERNVWYDLYAR
jgi:FkbM family methyltransferase